MLQRKAQSNRMMLKEAQSRMNVLQRNVLQQYEDGSCAEMGKVRCDEEIAPTGPREIRITDY